jgi:hypothetical protein
MSHSQFTEFNASQQNYQTPQIQPPRARSGCWLLGLLFVGGLFLMACCGGIGLLVNFGGKMITAEIEDQLASNPRLREHLGDIESFEMDWTRSLADEDDDTFVYTVEGTKGSGRVTVKHVTNDLGEEEIVKARLRLPDGSNVELVP